MCDAGFYCTGGARSPRPDATDATQIAELGAGETVGGQICPKGGYCEQGSAWPKYCQSGYYNSFTGKKTVYDCQLCPPGQYCAGEGVEGTSGNCDDGYYCLSGSGVKNQYPAPPGSVSNSATSWKTTAVCGQYQYNNLWHQKECKDCPKGFYCDLEGHTDNFKVCPAGYFCPAKQKSASPCPPGTYNPTPMAWDENLHCYECPPGYHCPSEGLATLTDSYKCNAGYFCAARSRFSSPANLDLEMLNAGKPARYGPCPTGHYCEVGTAYPFKCPIGTYNDKTLQISSAACLPCDAGYYGETTGLTVSTCSGKCA